MIFTTKAEYGVRLLIQLGLQSGAQPVSLKAVADAENLPLAYLERIAALLKKAELVEATRGAHGGYVLARPADEITMLSLENVERHFNPSVMRVPCLGRATSMLTNTMQCFESAGVC